MLTAVEKRGKSHWVSEHLSPLLLSWKLSHLSKHEVVCLGKRKKPGGAGAQGGERASKHRRSEGGRG